MESNYRELHGKTVVELRRMAREKGVRLPAGLTKARIVETLSAALAVQQPAPVEKPVEVAPRPVEKSVPAFARLPVQQNVTGFRRAARFAGRTDSPTPELMELRPAEGSEKSGVLEIMPDGYGFLRVENCSPGPNDIYVAINQIRRFGLRTGDHVRGRTRPQREGDRYEALMHITRINDHTPEEHAGVSPFESRMPVYPHERICLTDASEAGRDLALRMIDLFAPVGKGQRGLIVSRPKAGKTVLLKKIANAITRNAPEIHLMVLLIDERPEEVTDIRRSIAGEIISSTFDETAENHIRVAEMAFGRAQRLVETGRDVVILLDSITRLARAYNLTLPNSGRAMSGGLDPAALYRPKKFFGAARCLEGGGSLTVLATALVETGSRMDDIIYEEFKGTGNMEVHLNRRLSERRIFPAIDVEKSGTRRDELLLTPQEYSGVMQTRRLLSGDAQEMTAQLMDMLEKTPDNQTFLAMLEQKRSVRAL